MAVNTFADEEKFTISGTVKDKKSGEALFGATIYVQELKTGGVTNTYGFYSVTVPAGHYHVTFSYLGFQPVSKEIDLNKSQKLDIELSDDSKDISEVTITAEKQNHNVVKNEMSVQKLEMKTIKKMPAMMGETDVIKSLQLLPGVQNAGEGTSGFYVRGGNVDQNLILLDDATVYNASHLGGLFSVFNDDALKDVTLYKGGIPSEYGGRLSSLLDIRMKDGNAKTFVAEGGIGLIASRLTIEMPVVKDKSSFIISGRRTYYDLFFPLLSDTTIKKSKVYFYDLNAKFNYNFDANNKIFVSGYFGNDVMQFGTQFKMVYGNSTLSLRYNHLFNERLFSNLTLIYSKFDYGLSIPNGATGFDWNSNIIDYSLKNDYTFYINTYNTLKFGFASTYHIFMPGYATKASSESIFNDFSLPNAFALEHGLFVSNEEKIGGKFTITYGLRLSIFQNVGPGTYYTYNKSNPQNYTVVDSLHYSQNQIFNTYPNLEPRINIVYQLNETSSIKASYNRMVQYIQLATNTTSSTPLDVWFPSSQNVKPQKVDQEAIGYFRNFMNNMFETSVEVYYKNMQNVVDFKDFAQLFLNKQFEGELRFGTGRAYGLELYIKKQEGKFTGWISYTYSRTMRTIPNLNNGKEFAAPYDKPNNISVVASYDFTDRINLSANWVYSTGAPRTMPTGRIEYGDVIIPTYSDRNAVRLPDYHRLDLSLNIEGKKIKSDGTPKRFHGSWSFSIYNAYDRHNAYSIDFIQNKDNPNITEAQMTYLFKIFPSVTYNFKF